ncbi:hypothetical protein BH11PLA2_BH11PLA2_00320 [soil metagenome]
MNDPGPPRPLFNPSGLIGLGTEIAGFAIVGLLIDYATGMLTVFPIATLILSPLGLVVAWWHLSRIVRPPH